MNTEVAGGEPPTPAPGEGGSISTVADPEGTGQNVDDAVDVVERERQQGPILGRPPAKTSDSTWATMLRWVVTTPLGRPVVPLVR